MSSVTDLVSNPWAAFVVLADLALIAAAVLLVLRSDHLKLKGLWILLALVWPLLAVIVASPKFQRKWLWAAFSVFAPSVSFGVANRTPLFAAPVPVELVLGGSISLAAVVIIAWWLCGPEAENRVPAEG